jgi:hypothetical protein
MLGLVALIFLLVVGPTLPLGANATGVARWVEQAPFRAGEAELRAGHPVEALRQYDEANQRLPDTQFGTLAAEIAKDWNVPDQLDALARGPALDLGPTGAYGTRMEPYLLLGQIARLKGDTAQAARLFTTREVNDAGMAALSWARDHLPAPQAPGPTLDIGSGLDTGYVEGMYAADQDGAVSYRWTSRTATLKLPANSYTKLRLRWNGWRPAGWPPAFLTATYTLCGDDVCSTRQQTVQVPNNGDWHDVELNMGLTLFSQVVLQVNTFVPGGFDPRELGIRIDRIEWVK